MKIIVKVFVFSLLCALIPYGLFATAEELPTVAYQNPFYSFRYPVGWTLAADQGPFGTLRLVPPQFNPVFRDLQVKITASKFPHTSMDYFMAVSAQLKKDNLSASAEYILWDRVAANKITYQKPRGKLVFQIIRYIAVKDAVAFDLEIRFPQAKSKDLQPLVNRTIKSFHFVRQ